MPVKSLTANGEWNVGIEAQCDAGYRTLAYEGSLGGGTLEVATRITDGPKVPLADGRLDASKVDGNGQVIRQIVFLSSGNVYVTLSGATAPSVLVAVQ